VTLTEKIVDSPEGLFPGGWCNDSSVPVGASFSYIETDANVVARVDTKFIFENGKMHFRFNPCRGSTIKEEAPRPRRCMQLCLDYMISMVRVSTLAILQD
jgi:hypothetical protein